MTLESIVGVDIESEDGVDLNRFVAAQDGTKLPTVERSQDFTGHDRRGGFEHLGPAQQAAAVEDTGDHQTRLG